MRVIFELFASLLLQHLEQIELPRRHASLFAPVDVRSEFFDDLLSKFLARIMAEQIQKVVE